LTLAIYLGSNLILFGTFPYRSLAQGVPYGNSIFEMISFKL